MNQPGNSAVIGVAILSVGLAWFMLPINAKGQDEHEPRRMTVRGMVLPARQVQLYAPVDGTVEAISVEEGQTVEAGDKLLQMENQVQAAVVEIARLRAESQAELERAKLELEEAKITLERMIEAEQNRAARAWEVRRARVRRDVAAVTVKAAEEKHRVAEAELMLEKQRLSQFELTAPWAGIITNTPVEVGATLMRRDPVLTLISLTELEAQIHVPADHYGQFNVGDKYTLMASEPVNATVEATLIFADPVIDPGSQTYRCVFTIDNTDKALPAGFTVTLPISDE